MAVSSCVVWPTSTCPGWAAACRRAAALTTVPVTSSWPVGELPTAASPDSIPIRTCSGRSRPSSPPSRRTRSRIARPARTARRASSSCTCGRPNTAITASPMNFSGLPRRAVSSSEAASKKRPSSSRERSASNRCARPVESTMSAKRTVTILRSSVSTSDPAAAPQLGQYRAPSGIGSPHTVHALTM